MDNDGDLILFLLQSMTIQLLGMKIMEQLIHHFAADIATNADGENNIDVSIADIDGDGDLDIVSASSLDDNTIAWYENDGAADPTWTAAKYFYFNADQAWDMEYC